MSCGACFDLQDVSAAGLRTLEYLASKLTVGAPFWCALSRACQAESAEREKLAREHVICFALPELNLADRNAVIAEVQYMAIKLAGCRDDGLLKLLAGILAELKGHAAALAAMN